MSYQAVEVRTEAMLKAAFASADASLTIRTFWSSDTTAATEARVGIQLNLRAVPNAPADGAHRSTTRVVAVDAEFLTHSADDPKGTTCVSHYNLIRAVVDTAAFTDTAFNAAYVSVVDGGDVERNEHYTRILLPLQVSVCVAT
ncbi:hypothetical protein D4Q85_00320 [bacterium]|nr:MAG: hypothetical protein D4Q85_00320 [bacterium]